MSEIIWLIIGSFGAFLILLAFLMNQTNRWKSDDFIYDFVNLIGGMILIIYGVYTQAWPFVAINIVWSLYSLRDVIKFLAKK